MDLNKLKGELHSGTFHGVLKVIKEHSGTPLFFVHDRADFVAINLESRPAFKNFMDVLFYSEKANEINDLPALAELIEKFDEYAEEGIYTGSHDWRPLFQKVDDSNPIIIKYDGEYYYPVFEKTVDDSPLFRLYPLGRSIDE